MIRYLVGWVGAGLNALTWVAGVGEVEAGLDLLEEGAFLRILPPLEVQLDQLERHGAPRARELPRPALEGLAHERQGLDVVAGELGGGHRAQHLGGRRLR